MRKFQSVVVIAAVGLLAGLYIFGRTTAKNNPAAIQPMVANQQVAPADFQQVLDSAKQSLPPSVLLEINALESSIVRGDLRAQRKSVYSRLYSIWDSLSRIPIAAHYAGEAAKLENSQKSLTFAANLFLSDLQHTEDPALRKWEAGEANTLLQQASILAPDDDSVKVALADSYIEGGDVMNGVKQLLAVTGKDPDNIQANLMLGRLAVVSGQYEKAVTRLQGVLDKNPENTEAMYFLAEAYKGKGNTKKAIQLFRQCEKLVNDTSFSNQIENYIKTFENNSSTN